MIKRIRLCVKYEELCEELYKKKITNFQVYSPGMGHKSRSCFSAQATVLQAGDHLVLKDIGSARYTLFQHDKSFFGLVKVGELRQQQRHTPTHQ